MKDRIVNLLLETKYWMMWNESENIAYLVTNLQMLWPMILHYASAMMFLNGFSTNFFLNIYSQNHFCKKFRYLFFCISIYFCIDRKTSNTRLYIVGEWMLNNPILPVERQACIILDSFRMTENVLQEDLCLMVLDYSVIDSAKS